MGIYINDKKLDAVLEAVQLRYNIKLHVHHEQTNIGGIIFNKITTTTLRLSNLIIAQKTNIDDKWHCPE